MVIFYDSGVVPWELWSGPNDTKLKKVHKKRAQEKSKAE